MTEVTLTAYENEIDQMLDEARYLEAYAHLRHLLDHYPRYVRAYYQLGKLMLEAQLPQLAIDMFRRVLNADPEHLLARIGLGVAHQELDDNKAALWSFERAYELDPGNEELAEELRQLRSKHTGVLPDFVPLSRAGMARLYLRGDFYSRAVDELRDLLEEEPNRTDLRVALAEAYWRDHQIVQAADVCQELLNTLPYCLKANLLLGTLWLKSGQEEGHRYLKRAQEVDPENHLSQELFGSESMLPPEEISLERLVYDPEQVPADKEAEWFKRLEAVSVSPGVSEAMPEMSDREMQLVDITTGLESQVQIPDWLEDLGPLEDEEGFDWLETETELEGGEPPEWMTEPTAEPEGAEAPSEEEEVTPDWLQDLESEAAAEGPAAQEEVPDWLREMEPEAAEAEAAEAEPTVQAAEEAPAAEKPAAAEEEEVPDWLKDLEPEGAEAAPAEAEEVPDWLREMEPGTAEAEPTAQAAEEAPPAGPEEEEMPDWLRELQIPEEAPPTGEETEGMFGWTSFGEPEAAAAPKEAAPKEAAPEAGAPKAGVPEAGAPKAGAPKAGVPEEGVPEEAAVVEEAGAPTGEEMLSGDDALTWLQDFAAGKEDELRAQAEAERKARVDEIMGRKPTEPPEEAEALEEAVAEEKPIEPEAAAPKEGAAEAAEEEEVPEWLQQLEPEAAEAEAAEPAEEVPDWLQDLEPKEAEVEAAPEQADVEEMPDWLSELKPEEERASKEGAPEAGVPEAGVEEAGVPEADVPEADVPEAGAPEAGVPTGEEMLSGDDALSWLQDFAAGKEDELRAQAEAERKARVDEIMGRKPAQAAEEVVAAEEETVQEAGVPEAGAPEARVPEAGAPEAGVEEEAAAPEEAPVAEEAGPPTGEEMLSGDDALSWLQDFAAGKEDELRAQAEAERKARVDEIMGRKPTETTEEEAVAEEAPVEEPQEPEAAEADEVPDWLRELEEEGVEEAAPEKETTPEEAATEKAVAEESGPPTGEEMLSGDDALSWLQDFAAGKEDELRAQAEAERKARVDEIMGRKPTEPAKETVAEEEEIEEAPVEEPTMEAEAPVPPEEVTEEMPTLEEEGVEIEEGPATEEEFFGWSGFEAEPHEEPIPAEPAEPEDMITAFGFTSFEGEEAAEEKEDEALPAEEAPEAETAAAKPTEAPLAEAEVQPPAEEAPGEATPPAEEQPAPVAERETQPPAEETLIEALKEVAPPAEKKPEPAAEKEAPEEAAPVEEEPAPAAEKEVAPPAEPKPTPDVAEEGAPPLPERTPEPPGIPVPDINIQEQIAHIEEHSDDYAGRLQLARALWAANERDDALEHYTRLIRANEHMEDLVNDLQTYAAQEQDDPRPLQTLGDAYMKQGDMNRALDTYRKAMNRL